MKILRQQRLVAMCRGDGQCSRPGKNVTTIEPSGASGFEITRVRWIGRELAWPFQSAWGTGLTADAYSGQLP